MYRTTGLGRVRVGRSASFFLQKLMTLYLGTEILLAPGLLLPVVYFPLQRTHVLSVSVLSAWELRSITAAACSPGTRFLCLLSSWHHPGSQHPGHRSASSIHFASRVPCFLMTTLNTWPRQSAPLVTQSMGLHWSLDRLPERFLSKWHPRWTALTFLTGPCSISLPWKAASYLLKMFISVFKFLFKIFFFLVFVPLLDLSSFFLFEC